MKYLSHNLQIDIIAKRGGKPLREIVWETGVSAATISRIENGKMPDLLTYAMICKWLGVSLDTYFGESKSMGIVQIKDKMKDIKKRRQEILSTKAFSEITKIMQDYLQRQNKWP